MPDWINAIILGIVEGITEFLPISSTGHLIVAAEALNLNETLAGGTFEIFIQIGAVVAVIAFYWSDLFTQVRTVHRDISVRRLWLGIIIAFIPAAALGLLLDDWIQEVLFSPTVVAVALIVGGIGFIIVERFYQPDKRVALGMGGGAAIEDVSQTARAITLKQAFIIGCWQVLALIPGMSRSGMSIIGGMLAGLSRRAATEFSFYLAIPTLGGATIYTLIRQLDTIDRDGLILLLIGAVVSGIVAWLSIAWLLRYVSRRSFIPFGYYRIIVGVLILLLVAAGYLG